MRTTPYKGYALYEPDASPDLTESGEYNTALMAVDADMHDEEQARIDADTALNISIANEMAQRRAADDALNKRIDNAEAEISANSADLTGIKGLTYGSEHVQFIEHDNGSYSSPALDEIDEQITSLKNAPTAHIIDASRTDYAAIWTEINAHAPNVLLAITNNNSTGKITNYAPLVELNDSAAWFLSLDNRDDSLYGNYRTAYIYTKSSHKTNHSYDKWDKIANRPFYGVSHDFIISGNNKVLEIDWSKAPSTGITANTTWGELESAATQP